VLFIEINLQNDVSILRHAFWIKEDFINSHNTYIVTHKPQHQQTLLELKEQFTMWCYGIWSPLTP